MQTSQTTAASAEMVRFALAWAPFDTPEEEIFLTFGMPPSAFYTRVRSALRAGLVRLDVAQSAALDEHCRRRIGSRRNRKLLLPL
ncbi:hypothetical protein GYA93_06070 [Gordonia desulfuricans]|uniref:DUF3263 domain-containing protein n=1 Tax=Gordonia desulfuricans TaxID=89051 RepID=A0A7K3LLL9_9ACTN|nr:hypothetical protein [Gordonia desulfuricans]NDK89150.1 hypothetical protein [Gordonia desulfuricans]